MEYRILVDVQLSASSPEEAARQAVSFLSSGEGVSVIVNRLSGDTTPVRYHVDLSAGVVYQQDSMEQSLRDIAARFG
jgi:hypothetical protein